MGGRRKITVINMAQQYGIFNMLQFYDVHGDKGFSNHLFIQYINWLCMYALAGFAQAFKSMSLDKAQAN